MWIWVLRGILIYLIVCQVVYIVIDVKNEVAYGYGILDALARIIVIVVGGAILIRSFSYELATGLWMLRGLLILLAVFRIHRLFVDALSNEAFLTNRQEKLEYIKISVDFVLLLLSFILS